MSLCLGHFLGGKVIVDFMDLWMVLLGVLGYISTVYMVTKSGMFFKKFAIILASENSTETSYTSFFVHESSSTPASVEIFISLTGIYVL